MQKVTDFLEQYVEWVALAIGGLFLLFMVFLYLIAAPVSTKVGDRTVTPATVENLVRDGAGAPLESAMSHNNVPSAKIASYAGDFQKHMENVDTTPASPKPILWVTAIPTPLKPLKQEDAPEQGIKPQNLAGTPQGLPAPKYYGASTGKSNVQTDPAKGGNAGFQMGGPPAMGPGGMGGYPTSDYAGGMPVDPNAMGGGAPAVAAAPVAPGGADKLWATVAYTITAEELAKPFVEAKVPSNLSTVFLGLDVVRQEQLPDGSWGNDTKIEPLAYHQVPAFPKATPVDERTYADWASKNAMTLLAPSFYPKMAGDTWFAPGQPNPNNVDVRPVVNPMQPRMPRDGGPPQGMPGAGRRGRTRNNAPDDADRPILPFMQGMPPEAMEAMRRAQEEGSRAAAAAAQAGQGGYGPPPGYGGPDQSGFPGVGRAQTSVPDGYKVPSGSFNPSELDSDIFVWFHDDTVTPGKTYRYQMSYRVRNPLHGLDRIAQNAAAAKIFAIASPVSEWSEPVVIDSISRFFVASGVSAGSNTVRFDVFRWQDGLWHMKQFTASPGDMIGLLDAKIDYQTGWTLADLSSGSISREPVILADQRGALRPRSYQGDVGVGNQFKKEINWRDPNAPVRPVPGMMGPDGSPYGPPPGFVPPNYGPNGPGR